MSSPLCAPSTSWMLIVLIFCFHFTFYAFMSATIHRGSQLRYFRNYEPVTHLPSPILLSFFSLCSFSILKILNVPFPRLSMIRRQVNDQSSIVSYDFDAPEARDGLATNSTPHYAYSLASLIGEAIPSRVALSAFVHPLSALLFWRQLCLLVSPFPLISRKSENGREYGEMRESGDPSRRVSSCLDGVVELTVC